LPTPRNKSIAVASNLVLARTLAARFVGAK
jgi:hypothetical protein